jgi:hypothetical protein
MKLDSSNNWVLAFVWCMGLLIINAASLSLIINKFIGIDFHIPNYSRSYNKFVIAPLFYSPFALAIGVFYLLKRKQFKILFVKFDELDLESRKKLNVYANLYVALSFFFLALSLYIHKL